MKSSKGYTIIELIVVMSIISIVLLLTFPAFSNHNRRRSLQQGAIMLKQAIDQARVMAEAPERGLDTNSANGDNGYQVSFEVFGEIPEVVAVCPAPVPNILQVLGDCKGIWSIALPNGMRVKEVKWWDGDATETSLTTVPTQLSFKFRLKSGDMEIYGLVSGVSADFTTESEPYNYLIIRLESTKNARTKDLVMNLLTGLMYVKD